MVRGFTYSGYISYRLQSVVRQEEKERGLGSSSCFRVHGLRGFMASVVDIRSTNGSRNVCVVLPHMGNYWRKER